MAVRKVLTYPDPMLKQLCAPAQPEEVEPVVLDLLDTMNSFDHCVGLAAPQIGHPVRIAVVDITGHPRAKDPQGLMVMVNPRIEWRSEGSKVSREGCLSLPDLTANVRRPRKAGVSFSGIATDQRISTAEAAAPDSHRPQRVELASFEARCVLHEIDHLDGILFLDRVASITDDLFRRQTYS
ncbi:MAG: peptide deformylase [Solirubrobacterales bacterium]|nr:peptide deformylase [Solirubrobacterales bacterium]